MLAEKFETHSREASLKSAYIKAIRRQQAFEFFFEVCINYDYYTTHTLLRLQARSSSEPFDARKVYVNGLASDFGAQSAMQTSDHFLLEFARTPPLGLAQLE